MKRVIKVTIICEVDIDDEVDVLNETELNEALDEVVQDDLFCTEYLNNWDTLIIDDIGEGNEEWKN